MTTALKHRWSLRHNYLSGITAGSYWKLLKENKFDVDAAYWHRAAFIGFVSVFNSLAAHREAKQFEERVDSLKLEHPPLFVLGHWRTGTTHLHNLLGRDPQFTYPNVYDVVHPGSFLSASAKETQRFANGLPSNRPMDNVAYSIDLPQEEECALALTSLRSPDLALNFPRQAAYYERYLSFDNAPAAEVAEWKSRLKWYVKKLTLRDNRRLVLKSPPHTARIRLLLELFPDARFVNIHREPYTTFQSCRHAVDTFNWYTYLQKPDLARAEEHLLRTGRIVFDAYFDQRHLIPKGRLVDIAYEDLEARPREVLESVYAQLELGGFEAFAPRLDEYLGSLKSYKKNTFREIPPALKERIHGAWKRCFDEWGYPA